jgi:hypothetical protein
VTTPNDKRRSGSDNDNHLQADDNCLHDERDGRKDEDGTGIRRSHGGAATGKSNCHRSEDLIDFQQEVPEGFRASWRFMEKRW